MTTTNNHVTVSGITIRANWAQMASPIELLDGEGNWTSTPFQVADARGDRAVAARLVAEWLES